MKKVKEPYLKIPDHILSIRDLGPGEKMLLAHIYSFGARGCWQSNKTLAHIFLTSPCTISRWLRSLRSFVLVRNPKGYYRTFWAKSHPDVQAAGAGIAATGNTTVDKQTPVHHSKNAKDPAQKCSADHSKSAIGLTQKCATTINNTITENNNRTIASPTPLPAAGRASATLEYRKETAKAAVAQFKAAFARPGSAAIGELSEEESIRRRDAMVAAMMAEDGLRKALAENAARRAAAAEQAGQSATLSAPKLSRNPPAEAATCSTWRGQSDQSRGLLPAARQKPIRSIRRQ